MIRFALAISLFLCTHAAFADRGAVMLPQLRPQGAPELRDRFHTAIVRGLQGADDEVLPAGETRMRLQMVSEESLNCASPGCATRAAEILRAQWLVMAEIQIAGKDYTMRMRLIDGGGREVGAIDQTCEICTVKEAETALEKSAARLHPLIKRVHVSSPPPAVMPPREVPRETARPRAHTPAPPPVTIPPPPPPVTPTALTPVADHSKPKRPLLWAGVAMVSVGVVGLAIGIPLVAIDGRPTCNMPDPRRACKEVLDTLGGGAAALTIGSLALVSSIFLFTFDHLQQKSRPKVARGFTPRSFSPTAAASPGGFSVGFYGAF